MLFEIPDDWREITLGDSGTWFSGGTPDTTNPSYWGGDIPWITSSSLKTFKLSDSERRVTKLGVENGTRLVPKNTIIFVVRGMSLKKEFRVGIAQRPVAFGQDCKALIPNLEIDPLFLGNVLLAKAPEVLQLVDEASHGTGRLQTNLLQQLSIPLPPLPEQRKIAEILSTWDEAIDLTEQLIAAKQRRKQALMRRLLTGQVRFPGFEDEWEDVKLEDVAKINPLKTANISDEVQVSFVGMADVSEEAKLTNQTIKRYAEVKNGFTSFINDDILVAKITPCFENGKGALAQNLKNGLGFGSTEFHVIRANQEKANVHFLYYHTITHQFRERGKSSMTGSAGQKRVPAEFVTSFKIGLPSLSEQSKIVDVLVTCDQELDLHQQKLAALRRQKQGLMQQLLTGRARVAGLACVPGTGQDTSG